MIKAIIVDDEPLARSIVMEYARDHEDIEIIAECNDGFEALKAIQQYQPDLLFLDIQMPKINGFELLELLEQPPLVIFTTAFDEYAIRAFEANAVDYLLKPFTKERFDKALSRIRNQSVQQQTKETDGLLQSVELPSQSERIVVKTGGKIKIIPTPQVIFLEAADDYVKIHTAEGSFLKNRSLGYFEKILPAGKFVRTHRSYIVNVEEITRIVPYEKDNHLAILKNGGNIPVSRTGYPRLKQVLGL